MSERYLLMTKKDDPCVLERRTRVVAGCVPGWSSIEEMCEAPNTDMDDTQTIVLVVE